LDNAPVLINQENQMFQACIFDLDGTLVDSSEVIQKVMKSWCHKHSIDLEYAISMGRGARTEDTISMVAPHLDAKCEAGQIEIEEGLTLEGLKSIEGANEFIESIPKSKWAIVTSGSLMIARPRLKACNFAEPEIFVTAESVKHGKPHPEPYQIAVERLGLKAKDCLVFEDADNGVRSALNAGCKVVVIGENCTVQSPDILFKAKDFKHLAAAFSAGISIRKIL
jgi:mannitol-1-/sugar-/sorbitol-6-phosphatase